MRQYLIRTSGNDQMLTRRIEGAGQYFPLMRFHFRGGFCWRSGVPPTK